MIVFDLKCSEAHVFEAWFDSSADYEAQKARGLVSCPMCGSEDVDKAVMAPAVSAKGNRIVPSAERQAETARLQALRAEVEANCDYVGDKFAEEARKIHYGETDARGIFGEASEEEHKELSEEGIEVARIPWLPRDDA